VVTKNWFDDDHRCPDCDTSECKYVGWGDENPLSGCASNMGEKSCGKAKSCVWRSGYPPMSFSEDADYQLLDAKESFFAVDGSMVEMINNMDSNMLIVSGIVFVAVLLLAIKQCSGKKEKNVYTERMMNDYGSVAVVH